MRTNIDIDDALMAEAMKAGPFQTKKDAVEAGLRLLKRQATYREILKWRGKLQWEGDEAVDWTRPLAEAPQLVAREPVPRVAAGKTATKPPVGKRRAGR